MAMTMLIGCAASAGAVTLDSGEVFDYVWEEFQGIAQVPRPSGDTEAITEYMVKWGTDHGFDSKRDEVGNVFWEIPATAGYESAPLTALQVHMDMVCVSEAPDWDGVVTLIKTDDGYLTADHTSLGGDDGIGIISAMYLATSPNVTHGPLRVILTINEEGGSPSGVGNMDHSVVADAAYMVNIDSEEYATCTVSACGFAGYVFSGPLAWADVDAAGKVAYSIDISGLLGGHSGVDIHKNRANAIKAVDYCMAWAKYNGIDVQLASFTGGTGMTGIPALASAVIVFDAKDKDLFAQLMDKTIGLFGDQFNRTEAGYAFTYAETEMPAKALDVADSAKLIDLVAAVEDGVNTISQRYPGITETSFNVGLADFTPASEQMMFFVPMRLSTAWPALLANMQFKALANAFGYEMEVSDDIYLGWVEKEGDVLAQYYAEAFKEYTGDDCLVTAVHGGLECADFADWNPALQIISVGPTVISPHSTNERVPIDTVAPTIGSIATLLDWIAQGKLAQ
jgi:dipeptidase D